MAALTLDLVKSYLRYELDGIDNDVPLSVALAAGVEWVELYTSRAISGAEPDAIPASLLHGVLLYAGAFERVREGGGEISLGPVMAVCFPYRSLAI